MIIKSGAFIDRHLSNRLAYFYREQVLIRLTDTGIVYITERLSSVIGLCARTTAGTGNEIPMVLTRMCTIE
ncbi:MAG: hypothetical protein L0H94_11855 [Nitrospira sp.]|nr:hypothetical protein [Nitrospira sp.]